MSMNRRIAAASTDVSTVVRIIDSTTGVPETGIDYNDTGVSFAYRREEEDNVTFSLVGTVSALDDAHADGGFFHIGNGYYRLDIPDAAFVANPDVDGMGVLIHGAFDNVVVIGTYYDLLPVPGPATKAEMDTAFGITDGKIDDVDAKVVIVDGVVDTINTQVGTAGVGLTAVTTKIDDVDAKVVIVDGVVDTINTQVGTAGVGLTAVTTKIDDVDAKVVIVDGVVDSILAETVEIQGSGFLTGTDSLEAIRNRGDAAWTTGGGGSSVDRLLLVSTTIASTNGSTELVLSGGSSDNYAYNNCTIVIEDEGDENQKSVGLISDYVGSTKTITLEYATVFTMVATDKVYILAENSLKATTRDDKFSLEEIADAIWDETSTGHVATNSYGKSIGAAGAGLTAVPWNDDWNLEVERECTEALVALNLDHLVKEGVGAPAIAEDSYLDLMMSTRVVEDGAYNRTTDSLQGIRDDIKSECEGALQTYDLDHLASSAGGVGSESPVVDSYLDLMMTKASDGPQAYDRATDSLQGSRDTLPEANQVKMDLSSTKFTTIVTNIAAMTRPALPTGTTIGTPTATSIPSDLSETNTDAYKDLWILFTEGNCNKMARKITAYNGSSKTFTVESFPIAPENDKKFVIVNN